jgi:type IV pilus assembly protein PilW
MSPHSIINMQKLQLRSSQRGMSLVELMISMVIGLILLGTLAYFYLGSQQLSRTHDDLSRMEESGRNAMEIIGKAVRQAGFRLDVSKPLYVNPANNIGAIIGTDGGGAAFGLAGAATAPSDTLTIRHDPAWVEDATNPIKGREANCSPIGTNVMVSDNNADTTTGIVPPNTQVVEYAFRINPANATLLCSNIAANPAVGGSVVVDNIERMQITYGLRDATGAITAYIAAPTAAQWANVAAVRVSLLVRGPSRGITTNNSQTYIYNGETVTSTDGFLRQVYTSTFTVRNQAL